MSSRTLAMTPSSIARISRYFPRQKRACSSDEESMFCSAPIAYSVSPPRKPSRARPSSPTFQSSRLNWSGSALGLAIGEAR